MIISLIAAAGENDVIGKNNRLVWHMPADMQYYREKIRLQSIVMGRKTAESEDMFFSEKRNVLITRRKGFKKKGFETVSSLEEAFEMLQDEAEVFVTGGSEIYRLALPLAHKVYLTRVHTLLEGDAFFPEISTDEWELVWKEIHQADGENEYPYTFQLFERRNLDS